jgi:glycosyltransferase involved in cell wall biosynthesis
MMLLSREATMARPRFSIIIPTRERAGTLHFAIHPCLAQEFDNYEIIVCDNFGSPETRQVVEAFRSEKIVYVRSDVPLAMSDNWELAVSRARGEYLTIVGDEDAPLRHALKEADRLLRSSKASVLTE